MRKFIKGLVATSLIGAATCGAVLAVGANKTATTVAMDGTTLVSENIGVKLMAEKTYSAKVTSFTAVSGDLDEYVSYSAEQGDGTNTPYIDTKNHQVRLYKPASGKTSGGVLNITAKGNARIVKVTLESTSSSEVTYSVDDGAQSEKKSISSTSSVVVDKIDCKKLSFVNYKARLDIKSIEVEYKIEEKKTASFTELFAAESTMTSMKFNYSINENDECTVSNAYLRFGTAFDYTTYEGLVAEGAKFGVALSKDGENFTNFECSNIARVAKAGDAVEDSEGALAQYSFIFPVAETKYDVEVTGKCYVEVNGEKTYLSEKTTSLKALAALYIENKTTYGLSDDVVKALGVF